MSFHGLQTGPLRRGYRGYIVPRPEPRNPGDRKTRVVTKKEN